MIRRYLTGTLRARLTPRALHSCALPLLSRGSQGTVKRAPGLTA